MKRPKLKVTLLIDTEGDLYYHIPSPHFSRLDRLKWKINKLAGRIYKYPQPSRKGILNIIEALKRNNFPATFCIAGHLYMKECRGFQHFNEKKPESRWYFDKIGKDWYYWDKGGNCKSNPGLFFGDIIEKEKNNPLFEFGLHAFAHEALTFESREVIDSIISSGIKAASRLGIKPKSFAAPFEMIEDVSDAEKVYGVLRKYHLKKIYFAGRDNGLIKLRKFDIRAPIAGKNMVKIWISSYFEGSSSGKVIRRIINEIERNKDKDAVYCLATHDFTHKNAKNLEKILRFLIRNNYKII